jgi:hypothetical protein
MSDNADGLRPIIVYQGPKRNSFESCMGCVGILALIVVGIFTLTWMRTPAKDPAGNDGLAENAIGVANANSSTAEAAPARALMIPPEQSRPLTDRDDWVQAIPASAAPAGADDCDRPILSHQTQSLDGGYTYQQVCRWSTSDDIIQVRLSDGRRREVAPGNSVEVIRNGPWRGYLIVSQHRYRTEPQVGSFDASWVIRPDGKVMFEIPGTDDGDDAKVRAWLNSNGWSAS